MKRIIFIVVGALVVIGAVLGGYYGWNKLKGSETVQEETEISLVEEGLGEIPDTAEGIGGPEADLGPNEIGDQATELTAEDTTDTEGIPLETEPTLEEGLDLEPTDISGDLSEAPGTRDITEIDVTPVPRETRPPDEQAGTRPEGQPSETATVAEKTVPATTKTTSPAAAAAPALTPTPAPAPGNYTVSTIEPVSKSQLATVRKAMMSLGVQLQERKTERQNLSAYRIAVGYFRTKAEAESWAYYNFRPRGIDYYVYPVQRMFSIQVGVYSQQQNVELAMRELYRKYQGGRLPIRTEMTTITKLAYELSIRRITKSLADKIWRELTRLGIQAEISGM